jgi:hypothetical protein
LELGNLVYNKKASDYKYHATTDGLANCGESASVVFEIYVSYDELGIDDPDSIKMCFNYNNISMSAGVKSSEDCYTTKNAPADKAEENIESYFSIDELIK